MNLITVPGTRLSVSRFSFGTARLHHIGPIDEQSKHLRAAADVGFTHFDTAPLYGFGEAERALCGAFGSRSDITITTKVGLYPPGGSEQSRTAVISRKVLGRIFPAVSRPIANWSVERARESLDNSLRRLGRSHVDLLLIHEPQYDLIATEEWMRWLENEEDRVGAFGIAGPEASVEPFAAVESPLSKVIQTKDTADNREAEFLKVKGRELQFTYGYLTGNREDIDVVASLERALERNRTGSIVVSTRRRERLEVLADIERSHSSAIGR